MVSVGQELWIVAAGGSDKDGMLGQLRGRSGIDGAFKFDVPDGDKGLRFGSFDTLVRLTDDLQKADAQIDSIVHRLERQYLEIDPKADFKIIMKRPQRSEKALMDYLNTWQWDESRYSKTDSIADILQALMPKMQKLDEEARKKTAEFNDVKSQKANLAKKEGNLMNVDLVDVLTPQVVKSSGNENDDFIYTKYLTTVVVVLSRGSEKEFLSMYESLTPNVVPGTAKCFANQTDKDGNTLWRVVLCTAAKESEGHKSGPVDNFKRACRERRFLARDFEYNADAYKKVMSDRTRLETECQSQMTMITSIYRDAWSDVMHALIHVKAMRVFVESVLRFGMPPKFASFVVTPSSKTAAARKTLAAILGKGQAGPAAGDQKEEGGDDEEYFPYVSLSFTPFTAARG